MSIQFDGRKEAHKKFVMCPVCRRGEKVGTGSCAALTVPLAYCMSLL